MKKYFFMLIATLKKLVNESGGPLLSNSKSKDFAKRTAEKIAARETAALSKDAEKHQHKRKETRSALSAIAELAFPDRGFSVDGIVLEASPGGLTFRPAAHYIEERDGEQIQVRVNDVARNGIIRATRVNGYGIQLFDPFTDDDLAQLRESSVDLKPFDTAAAAFSA